MKTLREYIDQLDEISRRDALKYAGAAAAGAASSKVAAGFPIIVPLRWPESSLPKGDGPQLPVDSLTENDRNLIIQLWYVYEFDDKFGNKTYKQLAWEELARINMLFDIPNMGQFRALVKEQMVKKEKNDPSYFERLKRGYTNQSNQDKIIYAARNLVARARKELSGDSAKDEPKIGADSSGPIRPGFEGKMIDAGLVLYFYASKSNHESKEAIKAALNKYASKTGSSADINRRLKEISVEPSKFGPSTRPDQYFQQANQIVRDINALTEKTNENQELEESEPEDPIQRIDRLFRDK